MSAWSIINGYLGLGIKNGIFTFDPKLSKESYKIFFSFGNGTARFQKLKDEISISVLTGDMEIRSLGIPSKHILSDNPEVYINGMKQKTKKSLKDNNWTFSFPALKNLELGSTLTIK
jgi:hypothetical protein